MTRFTKVSTVLALALVASASTASAQSDNITVTANVFATLTVNGDANLNFGNVFPGLAAPTVVAVSDAGAGHFSVTGQAGTGVSISFTLPANLTGPGADIPVSGWTGLWNGTNVQAGGTPFTPSPAPSGATLSIAGELFVFIGAQIQPPLGQTAGTYTGNLVMTVAY